MKKKNFLSIVVIGLVLGLVVVIAMMMSGKISLPVKDKEIVYKHKVTLANGEWEPYFSEKLEGYGLISRIVEEAFAEEGVEVEFVFLPWGRGLEEAGLGKWGGSLGWTKTSERDQIFLYSDKKIGDDTHVFFHLKSYDFDWKTVDDLKDVKIAASDGFFYGEEADKAEKSGLIYLDRSPESSIAFKKMMAGKVDVAILDKGAGRQLINTLLSSKEAAQVTSHPLPLTSSELYLLLNNTDENNEILMKLFNKGYKKMLDSGKVAKYWADLEAGK